MKIDTELLINDQYCSFFKHLGSQRNIQDVLTVFRQLTPDKFLLRNITLFEEKKGEGQFWEICCSLNLFSKQLKPSRYLEIGVRRGRSMAQVAVNSPLCNIVGFDLWLPNYAGVLNPGPGFVEREIRSLGFNGPLALIKGNSLETVPNFLLESSAEYDLVTVDGGHSNQVALQDLHNVAGYVKPYGMLVFDDLVNKHHNLIEVWESFKTRYADRFWFVDNLTDAHGTGLAIKRKE